MRRIGAHLTSAGGPERAVDRALAIGADCLQIFSGSPRAWARRPLHEDGLRSFQKYSLEHDIRPIFVHALYLVNLASDQTELVQKSVKVLIHDLKFGAGFNSAGVVVHLGSHQGRGWLAVRENVALLIKKIIDEAAADTPFLIENSAGQNGKLCSDLSEVRWLLDTVARPSLGWCYDTCHGWAAGYYASQPQLGGKNLLTEVDRLELWPTLRCLHVNDSRDPFGDGRDRHDNIGKGQIDLTEFKMLLNHAQAQEIPIITEAPGLDGNGPDSYNLEEIKKLVSVV